MPLSAGTGFGLYKVLALLGAGGLGPSPPWSTLSKKPASTFAKRTSGVYQSANWRRGAAQSTSITTRSLDRVSDGLRFAHRNSLTKVSAPTIGRRAIGRQTLLNSTNLR